MYVDCMWREANRTYVCKVYMKRGDKGFGSYD